MNVHVSRAQDYPFNKSHVQVLEGHVLSPEIYIATHVATFSNCLVSGGAIRRGDRCWTARDLGSFKFDQIPTDDQIRDLAREKLAELAGLGLYTPKDQNIGGLGVPKEFFLPQKEGETAAASPSP